MSLEDRGAQHDKVIVDKYHGPNADYVMTTRDYVLRPEADGDSGAITITLPPVAEAKGRFYSICARNADAVNTITIQDRDESECWPVDIVFNGKCDRALLYSDGLMWYALGEVAAWPGISTTYAPGTTPTPTTAAPTTVSQATTLASTTVAPTTAG
jgi:hypothetical protein